MPTVAPAPGRQSTLLTLSASAVVKAALVLLAVPPSVLVAAVTSYDAPGTALRSETHDRPSAATLPASRWPSASVTVTEVSPPPEAVTRTGSPAGTRSPWA